MSSLQCGGVEKRKGRKGVRLRASWRLPAAHTRLQTGNLPGVEGAIPMVGHPGCRGTYSLTPDTNHYT